MPTSPMRPNTVCSIIAGGGRSRRAITAMSRGCRRHRAQNPAGRERARRSGAVGRTARSPDNGDWARSPQIRSSLCRQGQGRVLQTYLDISPQKGFSKKETKNRKKKTKETKRKKKNKIKKKKNNEKRKKKKRSARDRDRGGGFLPGWRADLRKTRTLKLAAVDD